PCRNRSNITHSENTNLHSALRLEDPILQEISSTKLPLRPDNFPSLSRLRRCLTTAMCIVQGSYRVGISRYRAEKSGVRRYPSSRAYFPSLAAPFQNTSMALSVQCPKTFRNSSALIQRSRAKPCSHSTA